MWWVVFFVLLRCACVMPSARNEGMLSHRDRHAVCDCVRLQELLPQEERKALLQRVGVQLQRSKLVAGESYVDSLNAKFPSIRRVRHPRSRGVPWPRLTRLHACMQTQHKLTSCVLL